MATDKKSFIAYCDWESQLNLLSDEEAGKLFRHLLSFVNDKNPEFSEEDRVLKMAFEPIRNQLVRDLESYKAVKKKRAEAGRRGGLKSGESRANQNEASNSNAYVDEQNEVNEAIALSAKQNGANEAVNDNGNVNDNVILLEKETKEENKDFPVFQNFETIPESNQPKSGTPKKVAQKKVSKKYFSKDDFKKKLLAMQVLEKDADDWIEVRRQKRAVFTENAILNVVEECEKYNFSFPEAIKACAKYDWQGFKYEWYLNKQDNGKSGNYQSSINGTSGNKNKGDKISGTKEILSGARYTEFT